MNRNINFNTPFINACVAGKVDVQNIYDYIDEYHNTHGLGNIYGLIKFLGITPYEYRQWVENETEDTLRKIVKASVIP